MNRKKISWDAGIPSFNRAHLLAETIDSLLRQAYAPAKIIISDNCSSDNTAILVESKSKGRQSVQYYRHASAVTPWENFKKCLELSDSEYFAWLQDDDLVFPVFGVEMIRAVRSFPGAGAFIAFAIRGSKSNAITSKNCRIWGSRIPVDFNAGSCILIEQNQLLPWLSFSTGGFSPVALFRRSALIRALEFLESSTWNVLLRESYFGEYAIVAALNILGDVVYVPKVLGLLRDHPHALSNNIPKQDPYNNICRGALNDLLEFHIRADHANISRNFVTLMSTLPLNDAQDILFQLCSYHHPLSNEIAGWILEAFPDKTMHELYDAATRQPSRSHLLEKYALISKKSKIFLKKIVNVVLNHKGS